MAPIPPNSYFPPLEKCLDGVDFPVSWKSVFSTITDPFGANSDHEAIERFLSDQDALKLLSRPFEAFRSSTAQTKAAFDTKTSAINVTPSAASPFDIKQIKDDALWLCATAKIDEISALRVVVVEYQLRTAAQLLGPYSDEELANLREAAGNNKYSNSIQISLLPQGLEPATIQNEFEKEDSRRQRILRTYLSERRHFWKSAEQLFHIFFRSTNTAEDKDNSRGSPTDLWLEDRARALTTLLTSTQSDEIVLWYIEFLGIKFQDLSSGCKWFQDDGRHQDIELDWIRTQVSEATHAMEILWQFVVYTVELPSSQIVLNWFRLLKSCNFFDQFGSDDPFVETLILPLQCVAIVISLELLGNLDPLVSPDPNIEVSSSQPLDRPFILNPRSISDLHTIILQATDAGLVTAGPVILTWSVFLQAISIRVENEKVARLNEEDHLRHTFQGSIDAEANLNPVPYENALEDIRGTADEDVIDYIGRRAVNLCRVFETLSSLSLRLGNTSDALFSDLVGAQMRKTILDVIKRSTVVGYIPEIIETCISTITGGRGYWDILDSEAILRLDDPIVKFLNDEILVDTFLRNAQSRYPYESLPFLQLVRALASSPLCYGPDDPHSVLRFLESMPVFTYTIPPDFVEYETTQEEDNNNNVRLTKPVHLFEPRSKAFGNRDAHMALVQVDEDFTIPVGTSGRIISESGPRVVFWFHQYPALKYFGKLLETFLAASDQVDATTGMPADRESVGEIIEILAILILSISRSAHTNPDWVQNAQKVLEVASSGLSRNRDIITVVSEIFEEELQNQSGSSGSDVPLDILVSCVHFIHAILSLSSSRVWPLLARSGLLGISEGGGRLSSIVEGVELLSGRYNFLTSCCKLFQSLLDDSTATALRRKSGSKSCANFLGVKDVRTGTPNHNVAKILLSFTRYLIDVLENSCSWRFQLDDDRRYLCGAIGGAFGRILRYYYGVENSTGTTQQDNITRDKLRPLKSSQKPTAINENSALFVALRPSATHLVESFLSNSAGTLRFQPLLRSYFDGVDTPDSTLFLNQVNLWRKNVNSILFFTKTLLRVGVLHDRPVSQLEKLLFNSSPIITRLYGISDAYKNQAVSLLESLVLAAASHNSEPPSLLGHLGPQTARNFLHSLSDLDKPLSRNQHVSSIWQFLSTVVSSRQQWFSSYLLTGKTPRDALKHKSSGKELTTLDQPLLTTALARLCKMSTISMVESLAMLEFIALSQNFWPWTVGDAPRYTEFIKSISEFVGNLTPPQVRQGNVEESIDACYQTRIAAYIAEILAMHLFHSRQTGVSIPLADLLPNLTYYERFGTSVPYYNASLHGLLKQNFDTRYAGCTPRDLKRTTLETRQFGKDYFYDLEIADKMLNLDQAWTGRNIDGMRAEFERANVNLSLVDSHIALFQSWKFLSIELSSRISGEPELQRLFAKVATDCLVANSKAQPPEEIFSRLSQTRADLALALVQRLVQANSSTPEESRLLRTVWKTISELRGNFEGPVPDGETLYYRSLLKLLFLTIRVHAGDKPAGTGEDFRRSVRFSQLPSAIPIIIEVLKYVVPVGLREVVTSIHESAADSSPEDLAILTGILQSCLRVPGIAASYPQIMSIMINNDAPNIAMRLFSWSDNLAIDGDPIYGELSIQFLLELSSIPMMAEQLAIEGLLAQIASASIMSYLRRDGISPFATGAGIQRCYSIWARGILPLILNILDSVQQSIAGEVAQFLNQFPTLLKQSEEALDAPLMNRLPDQGPRKYITLATCSELHSMALIIFILSGFRESLRGSIDIPEVKWDTGAVLENVEFWLGSRAMLRERLLPLEEREVEWLRKKSEPGSIVSKLEEKVVAEMMGIRDVLSGGGDN